ncbi:hypothetical protein GCM10027291_44030 [Telluribacter humicola]
MLCGCQTERQQHNLEKVRSDYKISKIGKLPAIIDESSGLAMGRGDNTFWTHNDSGGGSVLYEVDHRGALVSTFQVSDIPNQDWEDLAQSPEGILYIADTGNNSNTRRSFNIFAVSPETSRAETITFRYAEQDSQPSLAPESQQYDSEAMFYYNQKLYLFSKNRTKTDHSVKLYEVPTQAGDYVVTPVDSIAIQGQVTGADISPDGKTYALLTYGKILLFGVESGRINFNHPLGCLRLVKKQTEGIMFLNNTDLLVTNEQRQVFKLMRR